MRLDHQVVPSLIGQVRQGCKLLEISVDVPNRMRLKAHTTQAPLHTYPPYRTSTMSGPAFNKLTTFQYIKKYLYAPEVIPLIVPLTFACSLGVYMGIRQLRLETTRWETHPHFLGIQVNPKTRWLPNYKDEDRTETK
ncbi:hypothetical protein QOT17_022306 [Balamuthia mandrillaris]